MHRDFAGTKPLAEKKGLKTLARVILLLAILPGSLRPQIAVGQGLTSVATHLNEPSEVPNAGLFIHDGIAYVGGLSSGYLDGGNVGVRIVDLHDPANPRLIARIPLRTFHLYRSYSYGGAVVTDIDSEYFKGTIAVVTSGVPDTYTMSEYMEPYGVWDVTDPANPQFLSVFGEGKHPHVTNGDLGDYPKLGTAIAGSHFYYLYQEVPRERNNRNQLDIHLGIVDLTDPFNPVQVGNWQDTPNVGLGGLSVNRDGTRAYASGIWPKPFGLSGTHTRLYIVDVSDPTTPVELGRWQIAERDAGNNIASSFIARATDDDKIVVFADGSWGDDEVDKHGILHILDVSDAANILKLSEFDVYKLNPRDAWHMAVNLSIRGSTVYSAWMDGGLVAVDISDPANPTMTGQFVGQWIADAVPLGAEHVVASPVWKAGLFVFWDENTGSKPTGSEGEWSLPEHFVLHQNYPNPFNPSTEISFELPESSHVILSVFDLTGREAKRLADKTMPAGPHRVHFGAANLPGGVYLYRISAGSWSETRKAVLLK